MFFFSYNHGAAPFLASVAVLPLILGAHNCGKRNTLEAEQVGIGSQSLAPIPNVAGLSNVEVGNGVTISANTSMATAANTTAAAVAAEYVNSTVLVIARDAASAYSGFAGLNDHGIPYSVLTVPATGTTLPSLNDSATVGNFGLIVVVSEVSYNTSMGYQSALTSAQWTTLYDYQLAFGIRMVRLDVVPSAATGTKSIGGCCLTGEQLVTISNDTAFPTAGYRAGAGVSTLGTWHYPASIVDPTIAVEFARFYPSTTNGPATSVNSTAGVINNLNGRQQMVFFLPFSPSWDFSSVYLQHSWIQWGTRGLYAGFRRAMLTVQIDDMFLETELYYPKNKSYRLTSTDMTNHVNYLNGVNKNLAAYNAGSNIWFEVGHNGNGNIEQSETTSSGSTLCSPGPIEYPEQIDTTLEFAKPLGSGKNLWPANYKTTYTEYSDDCTSADDLLEWWQDDSNLNAFSHISHTFSHEDMDNATYYDAYREISWNTGWLASVGISDATKFSKAGIIPPAITGLHNGDALQAWSENGIKNIVGDNTRPLLLSTANEHWPLMSTVSSNGFAGIQITPRWATNIYYNCASPECCVYEWQNTSKATGNWTDLLMNEKTTNVRHLLSLHHDAFMFHQANLNYVTGSTYNVNGNTAKRSLLMVWFDTVIQEYTRLVKWPIITQKHDDLAATFLARMTRDACQPNMWWTVDRTKGVITDIGVTTKGNTCAEKVPVTFPVPVTAQGTATKEQVGNDPLTLWVKMSGSVQYFTLKTPIKI